MNEKLEKALELYKKLGYEETAYEDILSLGTGSKEEQKIAKDGLKSGEWSEFRQVAENTYGSVNLTGVDLDKLAIFAIRVGVDVRRTLQILFRSSFVVLDAISERGKTFASDFVQASCKQNRRSWEHEASVFGALCVRLVHRHSLPIPESVSYMKDWAFYAEKALEITATPRGREKNPFHPDLAMIRSRFQEHIETGIAVNMPATGPFSKVLAKGVQEGLIQKEYAKEKVFFALDVASRPGDRKEWMAVLRELDLTERDVLSRAESLIPLLSHGETPVIEAFAPILIQSVPEERLLEVLLNAFSAKAKKVRQEVLKCALGRKLQSRRTELAEWFAFIRASENKSMQSLIDKLAANWKLALEEGPKETASEPIAESLWRKRPDLWTVPDFDWKQKGSEDLLALASELAPRRADVPDIRSEEFLALANKIAVQDAEEAKRCLVGLKNQTQLSAQILGSWARNKEFLGKIDAYQRSVGDEKETVYSDLIRARDYVVSRNIDRLPCLLSTPSRLDLSIRFSDLVNRLFQYQASKLGFVYEADLQLALARLDLSSVEQSERKRLKDCTLHILLPSGEAIRGKAGKPLLVSSVVEAYLKDPFVEPAFDRKTMNYWNLKVEMPRSLAFLPNRFSYNHDDFFSIFPLWGDSSLVCVRRDTEVYHGQGLILRQVARRANPPGKAALMNLLAIPSMLSDENAEDVLIAAEEAWERGLLEPSLADIKSLDWSEGPLSRLASLANGFALLAESGLLPVLWHVLDDIVTESLQAPRMYAGTDEIVKVAQNCLEHVFVAVKGGIAGQEVLALSGIRKLAEKSGTSAAVTRAKELIRSVDAFLESQGSSQDAPKTLKKAKKPAEKEPDTKKIALPFEEVWQDFSEASEIIHDGITMRVDLLEADRSAKPFVFTLQIPGVEEYEYKAVVEWTYGLESEGQISVIEVPPNAPNSAAYLRSEGRELWMHWDEEEKQIALSPHRNWREGKTGPLTGPETPLSSTLLSIALALLAQDGDALYYGPALVKRLMARGELSHRLIREAMQSLLTMDAVSPAKLVRVLEKDASFFSLLWVMLPESVKVAGELTKESGKVPLWANRVLDLCLYYVDIMKEARKRGLIAKEDFTWAGLEEIASCKAKSAAKSKAAQFLQAIQE